MARLSVKFDRRAIGRLKKKFQQTPVNVRRDVFKALAVAAERVRTEAILSIRRKSPSLGEKVRYSPRRSVFPAVEDNPPNWDTGTLASNIKTRTNNSELVTSSKRIWTARAK